MVSKSNLFLSDFGALQQRLLRTPITGSARRPI